MFIGLGLLGDGRDTLISNGGDDVIYGDYGNAFIAAGTLAVPLNLSASPNLWNTSENPDIFSATSVPHTSVFDTGTGAEAVFRFITSASETIFIDIDYGVDPVHGVPGRLEFDVIDESKIATLGLEGAIVVSSRLGAFDSGSIPSEAFLNVVLRDPGSYLIRVQEAGETTISAGVTYTMHVSLTGQAFNNDFGFLGNDRIDGGIGDDVLHGMVGNDSISGGIGNDLINGGTGIDSIDGGAGNDTINGGAGVDHPFGGAGKDTFRVAGDDGTDIVDGGEDIDTLNFFEAGSGFTVNLASGSAAASFGFGVPAGSVTSVENVEGSRFDDTLIGAGTANNLLIGHSGNDMLLGLGGNDGLAGGADNDQLFGGSGGDVLNGGGGIDTSHYSGAGGRVIVDLVFNSSNTGQAAGDVLISIENVAGSRFNDGLSAIARTTSYLALAATTCCSDGVVKTSSLAVPGLTS